MARKFFGQYLLGKGLISKEQLLKTLILQKKYNLMIGQLAIDANMMSIEQVERINDEQKSTDSKFGTLALSMGFLTKEQLDYLLTKQKQQRRYFGEVLVEQGFLDAQTVATQLELHQSERSSAKTSLNSSMSAHPLAALLSYSTDTICKLFLRALNVRCHVASLIIDTSVLDKMTCGCIITINSAKTIKLAIAASEPTAQKIACKMLGVEKSMCDAALSADVLAEILNMSMGYIAKEAVTDGSDFEATPPDFSHSVKKVLEQPYYSVAVVLNSEFGPFSFGLSRA